jgi:hypothetical protein
MKSLQFAVHRWDGHIISRCGSDLAWPVLDYQGIGQGGDGYQPGDYNGPMRYPLEKFNVHRIGREWDDLVWTKKIPMDLKNPHRIFWGLKELKVDPWLNNYHKLIHEHYNLPACQNQ